MLNLKPKPDVSFVISARNEHPNQCHTIHSILNDCEASGIKPEIILVDNASQDKTSEFFMYAKSNDTPSGYTVSRRGMLYNGTLKVMYDPICGNVSARDKGVEYATGKYLFFSDAHISVKPGTIKAMIEAVDGSGGIVHPRIEWMGAFPGVGGFQYSLKIGEKFWGTWNRLAVSMDDWFYIPMSGHCFMAMDREKYIDFGGYNRNFRVYGGGEPYLDLLFWRLGACSVCQPKALVYHLSAGRGYSYHYDDLIHNMSLAAYTVGGMKWAERILITYLNKPGAGRDTVWKLYNEALTEGKPDYDRINARAKYKFEELVYHQGFCSGEKCKRSRKAAVSHPMSIWDVKNEEKFSRHLSALAIFEDWTTRLTNPEALDIFNKSEYQKEPTPQYNIR
jgi:glycosyltransferase involved in cell wall biosynthesis